MKTLIQAILIAILAAGPVLAAPKPVGRECVKLTQQISRYQRDAGWARDRENVLWETASLNQIERLATRRAKRCPEFHEQESLIGRLAALALKAGELAARYYLMGL
ncbi:MAG: hypothetical protein JRH01_02815 [Deltaproteobacteria bacterium]|nr:hypothetical protein [Deltaproteobacteria bacterium]MBW2393825.1 hypothetical protein [Deltaproteobacteria bacterium]